MSGMQGTGCHMRLPGAASPCMGSCEGHSSCSLSAAMQSAHPVLRHLQAGQLSRAQAQRRRAAPPDRLQLSARLARLLHTQTT